MKLMNVRGFLLLTGLIATTGAYAQRTAGRDTVLKASTIEVLQSYKPQIKQAPKPEWIPQLPPVDTTHPTFSYDVPQQTLYYTYSSQPLRPLALGKEPLKRPFENYVKLGGGNLSTLFLDAGIGGLHGRNYQTNIHLHHLSQKGDIENQQSSLTGIEAEGVFRGPASEWRAEAGAQVNQYHFYGYDHDVFSYSSGDVQQTYTTITAGLGMKRVAAAGVKFFYQPSLKVNYYTAKEGVSEPNVNLLVPFEYRFDTTVQALLDVQANYAHLDTKDSSRDNTLFAAYPGVRISSGVFTGHAKVGFAMGIDDRQFILPDIRAAVAMAKRRLFITAGWHTSVRQNTFMQLSYENPYMFTDFMQMQTLRREIYGELSGGAADHLSYSVRVSSWDFKGLPEFINPPVLADQKQFLVAYDTVTAVSLSLSARYMQASKWTAGITADFYSFSPKQQYVWHVPATRIKGDLSVLIGTKFSVGAYAFVLGGIHAIDKTGNAVTLDPAVDIGGNAEYQVVKRLSAFVQINNLLNNAYQRWYGYDAYGLNIYGGLRLKF